MEILLNLIWLLLGAALAALWVRCAIDSDSAPSAKHVTKYRTQLLALAVVLVILFPVISLSDDLLVAAQNPAETDCCVRRSSVNDSQNHLLSAAEAPELHQIQIFFERSLLVQQSASLEQTVQNPALRRVENRPPPSV